MAEKGAARETVGFKAGLEGLNGGLLMRGVRPTTLISGQEVLRAR